MKADALSFTFIGTEGLIKIPFFQRGYVWEKDNWEELLNDLLNENRSHFLGSIIMKQLERQTGNPNEVLVIDGQQRLTTLSVLIKTLYDTFSEDLKQRSDHGIKSYLFYKKTQTDKYYTIKIQHSHVDAKYYKQIFEPGIDSETLNTINKDSNKILQCYKYFYGELSSIKEPEREALFNRILDPNNKILVVIDLFKEDNNEQAIFDTINSAGVILSSADIIKNALFQKAIELYNNEGEVINIYNSTWVNTFITDEETIKYWDTKHSTGRLTRDTLEILLHSIAVIKGFYDPDKHTLSDLAKLYKIKITSITNKQELMTFIEEIKKYAEIYREKILLFDKSTGYSFENNVQRLLHILEILEISTFHPFILYLMKKYENEGTLLNYLSKLERFIMLNFMAGGDTKGYNKICKEFINNENLIESKIAVLDATRFLLGLQGIKNKYAALFLFWVELYRRSKDKKHDFKEYKYDYSLEHIMPQKWEEYWKDIPSKINTDGKVMDQIQAKEDRVNKIYWLGNMTLLTSSLNTSLRNYDFERKVKGDGRKKGMKSYADLLITKDDIILIFDGGDKVWDENKIKKRTNDLFSEIQAIWPYKV